jgi:hypothetical protein
MLALSLARPGPLSVRAILAYRITRNRALAPVKPRRVKRSGRCDGRLSGTLVIL